MSSATRSDAQTSNLSRLQESGTAMTGVPTGNPLLPSKAGRAPFGERSWLLRPLKIFRLEQFRLTHAHRATVTSVTEPRSAKVRKLTSTVERAHRS
jgi:hypothetical protein